MSSPDINIVIYDFEMYSYKVSENYFLKILKGENFYFADTRTVAQYTRDDSISCNCQLQ